MAPEAPEAPLSALSMRTEPLEEPSLPPLLIRKGATTRVALYGLGHMRDEQLTRALERKEVSIGKPEADEGIEWFNLLAIHQNRARSAAALASLRAVSISTWRRSV